jgi:hypothetical protein
MKLAGWPRVGHVARDDLTASTFGQATVLGLSIGMFLGVLTALFI